VYSTYRDYNKVLEHFQTCHSKQMHTSINSFRTK